jgi:hypothetical protein
MSDKERVAASSDIEEAARRLGVSKRRATTAGKVGQIANWLGKRGLKTSREEIQRVLGIQVKDNSGPKDAPEPQRAELAPEELVAEEAPEPDSMECRTNGIPPPPAPPPKLPTTEGGQPPVAAEAVTDESVVEMLALGNQDCATRAAPDEEAAIRVVPAEIEEDSETPSVSHRPLESASRRCPGSCLFALAVLVLGAIAILILCLKEVF